MLNGGGIFKRTTYVQDVQKKERDECDSMQVSHCFWEEVDNFVHARNGIGSRAKP